MLEKFKELNINDVIIQALNEMGFEEPTPIQAESIPVALSGNDMIGKLKLVQGKRLLTQFPCWKKSWPQHLQKISKLSSYHQHVN